MEIDHSSTGENPPYDPSVLGRIPVILSAVNRSHIFWALQGLETRQECQDPAIGQIPEEGVDLIRQAMTRPAEGA